jgi:hypothetical protein
MRGSNVRYSAESDVCQGLGIVKWRPWKSWLVSAKGFPAGGGGREARLAGTWTRFGFLSDAGPVECLAQARAVVAGHVVACRLQVVWLLHSEDEQAVIFGEVLVVFEVQGGERDFVGEAAGRDPHVVDWAGPPPQAGCCGQAPPDGGDGLIAGQDRDARQPSGQFPAAVGTPAADLCPLGQLTERDEGDERFAADQARGQRPGELAPVQ